jgi:DNA-binding winged helix-turn-helix (wHTH) protein
MQSVSLPDSDNRFAFDRNNQTFICDGKPAQLSPKAFEVLNYLFTRPRRLVTKEELLDKVWLDVCVVDAVLKNAVRETRKILDDDPKSPTFIETVHRRGYRFVGDKRLIPVQQKNNTSRATSTKRKSSQNELFLASREQEIATITHCWEQA